MPKQNIDPAQDAKDQPIDDTEKHNGSKPSAKWWRRSKGPIPQPPLSHSSSEGNEEMKVRPSKWSMGIMNDPLTDEVPGTNSKSTSAFDGYKCVANARH